MIFMIINLYHSILLCIPFTCEDCRPTNHRGLSASGWSLVLGCLGFACGDGAAGTADEAEVRSALCFADAEVNGDVDSCTSRVLERPCSSPQSKQLSTQTRGWVEGDQSTFFPILYLISSLELWSKWSRGIWQANAIVTRVLCCNHYRMQAFQLLTTHYGQS